MAETHNPQRPSFEELAPPEDPYNFTRVAVRAATPFLQVLTPTDAVLQSKGGIENLKVYRELLRDDQVKATWGQRRLALTACDTVVEPGADDAASKQAAEELQAELDRLNWDDVTDKALYAMFYGWGVAEILWKPGENRVQFDRIIVRDRARFRFDVRDNLYLWDRGWVLMPERKFWTVRHGSDHHDEPYGLGLANALYWPVWFKRNDIKFWLMFLEKFGMPTTLAKLPQGQMLDPAQVSKAKEMLQQITTDAGIKGLADLKGKTLSFGSPSSTSGHLMPRSFLLQAGIDPDKYWPPVGRIDQAYGDRNLVCSCPPIEAFAGN